MADVTESAEQRHASLFEHPSGTSMGDLEVDRILTVPNLITTVRLLCIPLFLYLLFGRDEYFWAGFTLGALGATDWVDGYVARRFDQTSTFGKMYDPTVDRLMMVVGIVSIIIAVDQPAFRVYAFIIVTREVLVGLYVVTITAMGPSGWTSPGGARSAPSPTCAAFPWFLFANEPSWTDAWRTFWEVLAWCAAVPGVVFSLLAAWQYIGLGRQALAEGRAERSAAALNS